MRMVTKVGSTLEETEQLLAEHNSFKEKARETREKVNYNSFVTLYYQSYYVVFQYVLEQILNES